MKESHWDRSLITRRKSELRGVDSKEPTEGFSPREGILRCVFVHEQFAFICRAVSMPIKIWPEETFFFSFIDAYNSVQESLQWV